MESLAQVHRANGIVVVAVTVAAALAFSWSAALGLGAGSLLMAADVYALQRLLRGILVGTSRPGRTAILLGGKILAFLGCAALCLTYLPVSPWAFGSGVAAVVFTTAVVAAVSAKESPAGKT